MSAAAPVVSKKKLAKAFGLPTNAKDLVQNFDFSKIKVNDKKRTDYLKFDLAPSYGNLTSESIKMMDDKLKIIISGTTRTIEKLPFEDRSWENVISALQQNTLLEPMDDGVEKSDTLVKNYGTSAFKFDGSADSSIVREVEVWFKTLVGGKNTLL